MKLNIQYLDIPNLTEKGTYDIVNRDFLVTDKIPIVNNQTSRSDSFAVAYCFEGNYKVELSYKTYNLLKGNVIFFKPLETHRVIECNSFKGILIIFNRQFFIEKPNTYKGITNQPYFEEGNNSLLELSGAKSSAIQSYFKAILAKSGDKENKNRVNIIRSLVAALLYELHSLYQLPNQICSNKNTRGAAMVKKFRDLVEEHFLLQKKVEFYAGKLFVSPRYLSDILREETGKNAHEIIKNRLLLEAKIQLESNEISIGDVARHLNFLSDSSFIRFFKKNTGTTPFKYKQRL